MMKYLINKIKVLFQYKKPSILLQNTSRSVILSDYIHSDLVFGETGQLCVNKAVIKPNQLKLWAGESFQAPWLCFYISEVGIKFCLTSEGFTTSITLPFEKDAMRSIYNLISYDKATVLKEISRYIHDQNRMACLVSSMKKPINSGKFKSCSCSY